MKGLVSTIDIRPQIAMLTKELQDLEKKLGMVGDKGDEPTTKNE